MKAFHFLIAALTAVALAEESPQFGGDQLESCVAAYAELSNIADSEQFKLADTGLSKLNATAISVAAKSNEMTRLRLTGLQKTLGEYGTATQRPVNYVNGKLKEIIQSKITAAGKCLTQLKKLNETDSLGLVPYTVADKFKDATAEFKGVASSAFQRLKRQVLPDYDDLVQEVEDLSEKLLVDTNSYDSQMSVLRLRIAKKMPFLRNTSLSCGSLIGLIGSRAISVNNQFEELNQMIGNSAAQVVVL